MLKSVKIENFRCFKSFELQQLGRINLLVGENNSGKTSILEAIQLLCSRTDLDPLADVMTNRGEDLRSDEGKEDRQLDIRHLFYGHEIEPGSKFSISGLDDKTLESLDVSIAMLRQNNSSYGHDEAHIDREEVGSTNEDLQELKKLNFIVQWMRNGQQQEKLSLYISSDCGLPLNSIRLFRYRKGLALSSIPKTKFIASSSLKIGEMIELFGQVVLTPDETLIEQALNKIDSKIKRIAPVSSQKLMYSSDSRGGFLVLLSDGKRVPIGSMGDGIWRILGLALAIVSAKDGYLFVDEIDTGLHFTAMSNMWKMIWDTAKRLNVQVFATTHNNDCWQSLADIAKQEDVSDDGIRIHRIEKGKEKSIVFTENQIAIAVERELEIR
ncbi:AAA family ATPase [Cylindrospermum sp. FACHB-282]|uniref:AAA family ATPase n=1 Tax=Cylindrospermum sp. FACHB-282 TaxID=2692794 RepID=UPI001688590D|nr:AAA family ATPase [Cylindrospermum sp. FACHB-282]MBD2386276.1 AAA family ATPase [Cylindrospermum sp. FACHB-282]